MRTASAGITARISIAALLAGVALVYAGCDDEGDDIVDPTVLQSVSVTGGNAVTAGQTLQLTATANFSNNTTQNVTNTATWVSGNTGVATVSGSGLVTGVSGGNTDIRATFQNVTGSTPLAVSAVQQPPDLQARFTVRGPNAGEIDICRLTAGGDINCDLDGSASTGGAGGAINQWSWRFDVGANSGGPVAVNTAVFNPSTTCAGYFIVKPPQTGSQGGAGFTQMVVKLVVRNAAGQLSAEVVNNNVRLFPNNACNIGF